MRTRTLPAHSPREDRLERLLRSGGEIADGLPPVGGQQPGVEGPDVVDGWIDATDAPPAADLDERSVRGRHRAEGVPLLSVPESLRSADLRVGMRAVRGLLVLVVVAVLVLGGRWWWIQRLAAASPADAVRTSSEEAGGADEHRDRTGADGVEAAADEPDPAGSKTTAEPGMAETGMGHSHSVESDMGEPGAAAAETLVVHVAGEVLEPGVVTVPVGSRVVDAVRAAGGLTEEADESTLNLARLLVDGERVWVGLPGETPPVAPGPVGDAPGGGGGGGAAGPAVPLDLNAATQADLEELPGVGPVTAGHILAWRDQHGRFSSVDELLEVSGIGERTLAQLEPLVTVGG